MDAELEQSLYDAEEEKALNADIERYHEYQRRHEAPTVYADPTPDRRPSKPEQSECDTCDGRGFLPLVDPNGEPNPKTCPDCQGVSDPLVLRLLDKISDYEGRLMRLEEMLADARAFDEADEVARLIAEETLPYEFNPDWERVTNVKVVAAASRWVDLVDRLNEREVNV